MTRIRGKIGEDSYQEDVDSPWLTQEQIKAYLQIKSDVTLRRLIQRGLPVVRLGRLIRSKASWIDEWLGRRAAEQAGERFGKQIK